MIQIKELVFIRIWQSLGAPFSDGDKSLFSHKILTNVSQHGPECINE